mgnify:CR=1 FL=1
MTQQKQTQSYLVPFIIMVVLMALIGLITNLNQQFQAPMKAAYLLLGGGLTNTLTTALVFTFFLAYLVMGVPSAKYIERKGYKSSLILGLVILIAAFGLFELSAYVFDTLDFPNFSDSINEAKTILAQKDMGVSAMQAVANQTGNFELKLVKKTGEFLELNYLKGTVIPMAYWVFLLASFVAGTALTFLQAVVNPYLVACDVKGTSAVQRQSIAGAGNSTMTTIGPLLVALLIFQGKSGLDINITSLYVPIAVLIVLVGVIIFALSKLELPNIASAEKKEGEVLEKSVWSFSHLALGVVAIFMYVGVEVCIGNNINLYGQSLGFKPEQAALMATIYWGLMLVGRLCGSFLSSISASKQLLITSTGAGVLVLASIVTNNPYFLVGAGLFHSVMWGAIFSLAIDKLGKYTSAGSGALMMGIFGGAVLPVVQGFLADGLGSWHFTWIIVLVGEAYLLYYALVGHKVRQLP